MSASLEVLNQKVDSFKESQKDINDKLALNTEMRTDQKHIKMALIGAIIVAAVGFGASLLTPDNTITLSQETINRIKSTE